MTEARLRADSIDKAFGAPVLRGASLTVRPGEVHALVGENGAGKSTLARIVAGLMAPDAGRLWLDGESYAPRTPAEARARGVAMVHQELATLPTLTVAESLFLADLPQRAGLLDRRRLAERARQPLLRVGLGEVPPNALVGELSLGQRQLLEIAAALARECRLLLLDEPTAALHPAEAEALFVQIDALRRQGTSVVYVSHRLEEIARLADQVTVLRDGVVVASRAAPDLDRAAIVRLMVGRDVAEEGPTPPPANTGTALRVTGLRAPRLHDVSFEVGRGEILGLAGLLGAGRSELLRAVFGADRALAGEIVVGDSDRPTLFRSPEAAMAQGLAFVGEDRKATGLLLPMSVKANVTLGHLRRASTAWGRIVPSRETALAAPLTNEVGVKARSLHQPVAELSGGNQQKALLARALLGDPTALLVDEPTRGVDVGARADVHRLLRAAAERGAAVVVASSDVDELLALCHRVLVLSRGRVAASFERGAGSREQILDAAVGWAPAGQTA